MEIRSHAKYFIYFVLVTFLDVWINHILSDIYVILPILQNVSYLQGTVRHLDVCYIEGMSLIGSHLLPVTNQTLHLVFRR